MQKTCRQCSAPFEVASEDLVFYEKVSPVFNGKKELIPPPTLCPDCRMQRRLAFRNEKSLYHRKCDLTGRQIISMYRPDGGYRVFEKKEWFSDKWDALEFGREIDWQRSFLDQFKELQRTVPRMSIIQQGTMINSDFCNCASNDKNCFLISGNFNEDCFFGKCNNCRSSLDCENIYRSELCYECIDCFDCYGCSWASECHNCSACHFCKSCIGCSECILCTNLHQKKFCIMNEQLSEETYHQRMNELKLSKYSVQSALRGRFAELKSEMIVKEMFGTQNEHSTGNNLNHCRNVRECYDCRDLEDGAYSQTVMESRDCMDFSFFGKGVELIYEVMTCGYACQRILFCVDCWENCSDLLYCALCIGGCKSLFGCVGLRHKEYCILNRQYTKEEYEHLVPKIIGKMRRDGEWGEFFPFPFSTFAYNETLAQIYFPLDKSSAESRGFTWADAESQQEHYLGPAYEIPDDSVDATDELTKQILRCSVTGRHYKIIPQEMKLYRQLNIPIPRKCPDQRYRERMALRNPYRLWNRQCAKCQKGVATSYQPSRPEIVYCESCYLSTVY
ncbi:MAG: hypothetical protein V1926_02860 [Candidatus Peregrinibacteria bacterium]